MAKPHYLRMPFKKGGSGLNPTSPTGVLFRTLPVTCDFLVFRELALPCAELPGRRPQIPRPRQRHLPRRRHLVGMFSGFKFVLQK